MTSGRTFAPRCAANRTHGFTLVEVLIALIIMSVGMLGIASLYVHGMQAGRTSLFRHNAVTLAGDIADRIRANPTAGVAYEGTVPATPVNCYTTNCNVATMASNDLYVWDTQAKASLPTGSITIAHDDSVTPSTYTITVSWTEPGVSPAPTYSVVIPVLNR